MLTRLLVASAVASVCLTVLVSGCKTSSAPEATAGSQRNEKLRRELLRMQDRDQTARLEVIIIENDPARITWLRNIDRTNTMRMKVITRDYGWPTISMVGEDGAAAASLLVGHAKADIEFMRQCVELMRAAVEKNEASVADYAHLYDKVRVEQGQPQYYGTQLRPTSGGRLIPEPIEDEANVDRRRQSIGLPSMKDMEKLLQGEFRGRGSPGFIR